MAKFYSFPNWQSFSRCPLCDHPYDSKKIKVIEKKDGLMVLYLNCSKCKSSIMLMVSAGLLGITSVSIITDITEKDMKRFQNKKPISADDVLDLHTFLKEK